MKKRLLFLLTLLTSLLGASSVSDFNGVSVSNVKVPFYKKDLLQSMIFAEKAEYRAQLLYGHNVVINMLQKKVNPDHIRDDWKLQIYPLGAPFSEVAGFWAKRHHYCDAVLFTPESALDQAERSAASDKEIKMRSPLLDLDGVGFAADFKRRQIKINSKVRLVMRSKESDPRNMKNKLSADRGVMQGTSEMLHIDTEKRRIMLLGQVTVWDKQLKLTCDRLTVEMGQDARRKDKSSMDFSGVQKLHADGNVKVVKILARGEAPENAQELKGDHLVYDVAKGELTVTGDRKSPEISTGKGFMLTGKELVFFREKQQLIVPSDCRMRVEQNGAKHYLLSDYGNFNFSTGICDFLGRVRISAPQYELGCSKMRVYLERAQKKAAPPKKQIQSSPLAGTGSFETGSLEFKRALCRGSVKMFRREEKGFSTLSSREAELDYFENKARFSGDVKCVSGGNTLDTSRLIVNLQKSAADPQKREVESAEAFDGVKITSAPGTNGETALLTAKQGRFDYKADRIDFSGDVSSIRGKSRLKCETLQLYLGAKENSSPQVAIPGVAASAAGNKTLKQVIASGNAFMQDGTNSLAGDRIEYFFVPAAPGAANDPGMFQSGSLRLVKVISDGNVKLAANKNAEPDLPGITQEEARPKSSNAGVMLGKNGSFRELSAGHLVADLLKHETVFTDNVSITDGASRMDCGKLELFTKTTQKSTPQKEKTSAAADPDADPFDLPTENSVPSTIALGNGLELEKAVASDNVVIHRRPNPLEKGEKLFCDRAFFNSSSMTIECTGTESRRPMVEGSGRTHSSDKFTIYLKDERIESTGDSVTQ